MAEDIQLEGTWKLAKTSVLTLHIDQESIDWVQKQYDGGETELTINFPEDKTVLVLHFAVPPQRRIKTP